MADPSLQTFMAEVKVIEQRDKKMTSKDQIERLTKPGSSFLNLNPFEVLQLETDCTPEEAKKQLRKFSILLHPDKNRDNKEGAEKAFDIVRQAHEMLHDEGKMARIMEILEEANYVTDKEIAEKKKQAKGGPIPEDDAAVRKELLKKITRKTFAEHEMRKRELEQKVANEKRREHEKQQEVLENREKLKKYNKDWEESRDSRVNSWRDFQKVGSKKEKKKTKRLKVGVLKPPKLKQETR